MIEYSPGYAPPTDSPIEDILVWSLTKYIAPESTLATQVNVDTVRGCFRLDFLVTNGPHRVAFECDGREFHQDPLRDDFRDALILGVGAADHVWRFRGSDLWRSVDDCLFVASRWTPGIFSERGLAILDRLACAAAHEAVEHRRRRDHVFILGNRAAASISCHHLGDPLCQEMLDYATAAGAEPLEETAARWEREQWDAIRKGA